MQRDLGKNKDEKKKERLDLQSSYVINESYYGIMNKTSIESKA